jgi:hypothetical protein
MRNTHASSPNPAEVARQEGEGVSTLLYLSNFISFVNVLTPPSVSPYACVFAYFYKYFQGSC